MVQQLDVFEFIGPYRLASHLVSAYSLVKFPFWYIYSRSFLGNYNFVRLLITRVDNQKSNLLNGGLGISSKSAGW